MARLAKSFRFIFTLFILLFEFAFGMPIAVEDYLGEVKFEKIPEKVIYLGDFIEVPASFLIKEKIVAMGGYGFKSDVFNKEDLSRIIPLNDSHYSPLNIEELKRLKVDLIVTYAGNPGSIKMAKNHGIKILSLIGNSIESVYKNMEIQAKIFEKMDRYDLIVAESKKIKGFLEDRLSRVKNKKKAMMVFHKENHLSGKNSLDSELVRNAGLINLGDGYIKGAIRSEVNIEKVVRDNPDIIFIWWLSPLKEDDFYSNSKFQNVNAIKNREIYKMPNWDRGGPRVWLLPLFMASKAYPNEIGDVEFMIEDFNDRIFN